MAEKRKKINSSQLSEKYENFSSDPKESGSDSFSRKKPFMKILNERSNVHLRKALSTFNYFFMHRLFHRLERPSTYNKDGKLYSPSIISCLAFCTSFLISLKLKHYKKRFSDSPHNGLFARTVKSKGENNLPASNLIIFKSLSHVPL
jgi:hypothetical protein